MSYVVNEVFYSLQGEGLYAGSANVFVRFTGCNLTCARDNDAGFDCDTEFNSGIKMTAAEIVAEVMRLHPTSKHPRVILTGGEPLLQVDEALVECLLAQGCTLALETNGTQTLPRNWHGYVACSPKTAEHTLRIGAANELRYVRNAGQGLPRPRVAADALFLSPAWTPDRQEWQANVKHCMQLVRDNPAWRFSTQQHKLWSVR